MNRLLFIFRTRLLRTAFATIVSSFAFATPSQAFAETTELKADSLTASISPALLTLLDTAWRDSSKKATYDSTLAHLYAKNQVATHQSGPITLSAAYGTESKLRPSLAWRPFLDLYGAEALSRKQQVLDYQSALIDAEELKSSYYQEGLRLVVDLRRHLRQLRRYERLAASFDQAADAVKVLSAEGLLTKTELFSFDAQRRGVDVAKKEAEFQVNQVMESLRSRYTHRPEDWASLAEGGSDFFSVDFLSVAGEQTSLSVLNTPRVQLAAIAVKKEALSLELVELSAFPSFRLDAVLPLLGQNITSIFQPKSLLSMLTASSSWVLFDRGLREKTKAEASSSVALATSQYLDVVSDASADLVAAYAQLARAVSAGHAATRELAQRREAHAHSRALYEARVIGWRERLLAEQSLSEGLALEIESARDQNQMGILLLRQLGEL